VKALIGAAPTFAGPGFLLPTRNHDVFRWCLERGLRLVKQQTLMTIGLYNEPAGAWLPGILYWDGGLTWSLADGIHRISTRVSVVPVAFTFNQYLIVDDKPLL
jgi:hypothetical protein